MTFLTLTLLTNPIYKSNLKSPTKVCHGLNMPAGDFHSKIKSLTIYLL